MRETLLTFGKSEINALSDGIVLLDANGVITGISSIPPPMLKQVLENRQRISAWVVDAVKGILVLPATVELQEVASTAATGAPTGHKASLCLNGRRGYALVIRSAAASERMAGSADVVPLMGQEILDQLRSTAKLLRRFESTGTGVAVLRKQAAKLSELLADVTALAELRGRDMVFSEDRFQLREVLHDLMPQLPRQSGDEAIHYDVDDRAGDLGNIYGSRHWLQQALHTLLVRLAAGCPPRGQVRIEIRQLGDFVLMTGVTVPHPAATASLQELTQNASRPASIKEGGLAMDICRRIIDLHGGQMKLNPVSGDADNGDAGATALESLTLSLPTGLPVADRSRVSCAQCRITFQALQYARDLAEITAQDEGSKNEVNIMRKTA